MSISLILIFGQKVVISIWWILLGIACFGALLAVFMAVLMLYTTDRVSSIPQLISNLLKKKICHHCNKTTYFWNDSCPICGRDVVKKVQNCEACGTELTYKKKHDKWYCPECSEFKKPER